MNWIHLLLVGLLAVQCGVSSAWADNTECKDSHDGTGHCDDHGGHGDGH
jgi:hypothetical protein